MILALAGGVGGAKLARGLAAVLPPGELTIVVNTGDDFEHLGLTVCPDIDTVTYTLAGLANAAQGWGLEGESWGFMDAARRLGGADWFQLGDRDLATHVLRTERLKRETLSTITTDFARKSGINHAIVPMSDHPVRSIILTDQGELPFQDYFVRLRCEPAFRGMRYDGIEAARPSPAFLAALENPLLEAILICPSNPLLSIDPILALPGIEERIRLRTVPLVAVSPFIGGAAVKGPAGKIMAELGLAATPRAVAGHYRGLLDGLVIDHADAVEPWPGGPALFMTDTLMRDDADKSRLAAETIAFAQRLAGGAA